MRFYTSTFGIETKNMVNVLIVFIAFRKKSILEGTKHVFNVHAGFVTERCWEHACRNPVW